MTDVTYSIAEQNAITKGSGFNLANFEELKKMTEAQVNRTIKRYHPNHWLPTQDIAWDCFTTLWMKGFFHRYDVTQSQKTTYLWNGVKNYLIDQERGVSTRLNCLSLDVPISEKSTRTLGEMIDERLADITVSIESYLEVLEVIRPESTGKRIKFRHERLTELPDIGKIELSGYAVLYMSLSGYRNKEIAERFDVSTFYISQLYKKGVDELRDAIEDNTFDGNILECFSVLKGCLESEAETYICPHCGSKKTRFWSSETWSGVPFYICKECTKSFSEFTNTPIQKLKNVERLKFIDLGRLIVEGCNTGQMSVKIDLGVDKVKKWADMFRGYFVDDPAVFIQRKLKRWERIIHEAEQRKSTWKK